MSVNVLQTFRRGYKDLWERGYKIMASFSCLVCCSEVCYPPFGCFNGNFPFDEALLQLPWSPKDIDTKFLYYTRNDLDNPSGYINITDPKSPSKVGFDANKPTIILTHGYIGV